MCIGRKSIARLHMARRAGARIWSNGQKRGWRGLSRLRHLPINALSRNYAPMVNNSGAKSVCVCVRERVRFMRAERDLLMPPRALLVFRKKAVVTLLGGIRWVRDYEKKRYLSDS